VLLGGLTAATTSSAGGKESGVKEGQPAPQIEPPATQVGTVLPDKKDAKTLKLQEFKGKKNVVLFFFPKAMTKG
jgi:peroxiredoxin